VNISTSPPQQPDDPDAVNLKKGSSEYTRALRLRRQRCAYSAGATISWSSPHSPRATGLSLGLKADRPKDTQPLQCGLFGLQIEI